MRKYEIHQTLGKGAYAIVFKALKKKSKRVVAIKKICEAFTNNTDTIRTFREIAHHLMLQNVPLVHSESVDLEGHKGHGHPNIIGLCDFHKSENGKDVYLVFDYMETDLHAVVRANILESVHKQFIAYQALKALKYCHTGGLMHRDLKPSNLLLQEDCTVKLADFGLSRLVIEMSDSDESASVLTDYVATRWYRAPEVLLGSSSYTTAIDVWSLGCIIAEMYVGKPLLAGTSTMNQLEKILEVTGSPDDAAIEAINSRFASTMLSSLPKKHPPASKTYTSMKLSEMIRRQRKDAGTEMEDDAALLEAIDMVACMLQIDPTKRIDAHNALRHPWMQIFMTKDLEATCDICKPLVSLNWHGKSMDDYRNLLYTGLKVASGRHHDLDGTMNKFFATFSPSSCAPSKQPSPCDTSSSGLCNAPAEKEEMEVDWPNFKA